MMAGRAKHDSRKDKKSPHNLRRKIFFSWPVPAHDMLRMALLICEVSFYGKKKALWEIKKVIL